MTALFSRPKKPDILQAPAPVEEVVVVEETAQEARRREKKKLLSGGRRATRISGIMAALSAALKKRLGE